MAKNSDDDFYEENGSSWMEKNNQFESLPVENDTYKKRNNREHISEVGARAKKSPTFREDFRGTRVFVQGIPEHANWQELKDHFRVAGDVVFASVSTDRDTNKSKGHGIVQFETVAEAENACKIIRNHPMDGAALYVRPDRQQSEENSAYTGGNTRQPDRGSLWKCANDSGDDISAGDRTTIMNIVKARDAARRRKNFDAADAMREQLKVEYSIHLDDRLKLWWKQTEGNPAPDQLNQIKGEGHWKNSPSATENEAWRQIPTTPEKDACADPNLVRALLQQRDIARLEKDYFTADTLLDEAVNAPNTIGLTIRIHDESRTWRVWAEESPQRKVSVTKGPVEQCLELVEKYDPEKMEEVKNLLKGFPGREYNILKKLKQRYYDEMQ